MKSMKFKPPFWGGGGGGGERGYFLGNFQGGEEEVFLGNTRIDRSYNFFLTQDESSESIP